MSFFIHFPLFSIIAGLVATVLCSLFSRNKARICTAITEAFALVSGILVLIYTKANGNVIYQMGHLTERAGDDTAYYWFHNVIRFGVFEGILATIFPLLLFFCVFGAQKKLQEDLPPEKEKFYYVLANLTLVALLALVYADDTFTGYVFLEISTLSSIGLVAIKNKGRTTLAAIRYMIFNLVGSGLYLLGIVFLYDLTGYFMFEKIGESLTALTAEGTALPAIGGSFALIIIGLGIKSGLFPFCYWMADTYGESTTASAGIISGLISKGYIILLMKFLMRAYVGLEGTLGMLPILFFLGIAGMIFGSISALFEKRINKMIAYSSAAQIGYLYLAMGLGRCGMEAAIFQLLTHAVTKPLLFLTARGLIDVSDHHPQFRYLRGSGKRNRWAGIGFSFGALSMIGFPLTAGFTVKILFVEAALSEGIRTVQLVLTIAALVISTLLNTGYFIHTVITLYSEPSEQFVDVKPHNRLLWKISVCGLIVLNVIIGVSPKLLTLLSEAVTSLLS